MNDKDIITAPPKSKRYEIWDDQVKGLHVRILPDGAKSFHLRYKIGDRYRKSKIGTYRAANATTTQTSLKQARENAKAKLKLASNGTDPFLETKRKVEQEEADALAKAARKTFRQLADDYIELYSKPHKDSWKRDQEILDRDVLPRLGAMPLEEIRKADIADVTRPILKRGSPSSANYCFSVMRAVFNWGSNEGYGGMEYRR